MRLLGDRIEEAAAGPGGQDYKTRLQELCARRVRPASPLPGHRRGSRSRQAVRRRRSGRGAGAGHRAGPLQEAGRAGGRPGGVAGLVADAVSRGGAGPAGGAVLDGAEPPPAAPDGSAQAPPSAPAPAVAVPELPEVETIRRDLDKEFVSQRIKKVEVTGARSVRRHGHDAGVHRPAWRAGRIDGVAPPGQVPAGGLDSGDVLVVHLGMSGQLLRAGAADPLAEAHPRGAHLQRGRPAAIRGPADLRRAVRHRSERSRRPSRAGPPRARPTRRPAEPGRTWPGCWAAGGPS